METSKAFEEDGYKCEVSLDKEELPSGQKTFAVYDTDQQNHVKLIQNYTITSGMTLFIHLYLYIYENVCVSVYVFVCVCSRFSRPFGIRLLLGPEWVLKQQYF